MSAKVKRFSIERHRIEWRTNGKEKRQQAAVAEDGAPHFPRDSIGLVCFPEGWCFAVEAEGGIALAKNAMTVKSASGFGQLELAAMLRDNGRAFGKNRRRTEKGKHARVFGFGGIGRV
jgi:hypothetical protein